MRHASEKLIDALISSCEERIDLINQFKNRLQPAQLREWRGEAIGYLNVLIYIVTDGKGRSHG